MARKRAYKKTKRSRKPRRTQRKKTSFSRLQMSRFVSALAREEE